MNLDKKFVCSVDINISKACFALKKKKDFFSRFFFSYLLDLAFAYYISDHECIAFSWKKNYFYPTLWNSGASFIIKLKTKHFSKIQIRRELNRIILNKMCDWLFTICLFI